MMGSGLETPNVSAPQIAENRPAQPKFVEQPLRQPFQLVGAHCEAIALRREVIEGGFQPLERPRGVGDVGGVIVDEIPGQAVDVADTHRAAFEFEAALDQFAGAGADHVARRMQRYRRQAFTVEHVIECGDQVGRGVDQGAVEIEDNGAGKDHGNSLAAARKHHASREVQIPGESAMREFAGKTAFEARFDAILAAMDRVSPHNPALARS